MRSVQMIHGLIVTATLAAPLGACGRGELAAGVTDSAFVTTMAELRHVAREPGLDSARRAAARAAVLQRRGLTPEQLESAARSLTDDPKRATLLWQRIDMKANAPIDTGRRK